MEHMLLPQFSLRWMFGIMTGCAAVSAVFALALRGSGVATAVSVAILALVAVLLVHVTLFALLWAISGFVSPMAPPRQVAKGEKWRDEQQVGPRGAD
jgi:hypothetical protein